MAIRPITTRMYERTFSAIQNRPRLAKLATDVGRRFYSIGARMINTFGPETVFKPRDKETICGLLGDPRKKSKTNTLFFKMKPDGTIVQISNSVDGFLGIPAAEVVKRAIKFSDKIRDDLKGGVNEAFRGGMETGDRWGGLTKIHDEAGNQHTIDTYLRAIKNERGQITSFVGIVFDVTDIRATEKELKKLLSAHTSIMRIYEMIARSANLNDILSEITKAAVESLPIDACKVKLLTEDGRFDERAVFGLESKPRAGAGTAGGLAPVGEAMKPLSSEACEKGCMIGTADIKAFNSSADERLNSGLYAGLGVLEGTAFKKIGVLTMYTERKEAFTKKLKHIFTEEEIAADSDLKLIKLFVELCSYAIGCAELAVINPLTGIPTRRVFRDSLISAIKLAVSKKLPVSILWPDGDKFKGINTAFGEKPHGDNVIAEFARRLKKIVRPSDFLAQYGGDEFQVLLIGEDETKAKIAAERILTELKKMPPIIVEANVPAEKIARGVADGLRYFGARGGNKHLISLGVTIGGVTIPARLFEEIDVTDPKITASVIERLAERLADQAIILALQATHEQKHAVRGQYQAYDPESLFDIVKETLASLK